MSAPEITLPLLCRAIHLRVLPGQPEGARYIVCAGAGIHAPEGSLGYLVSCTGKRTGHVIAWLRDGGYVYACDDYLAQVPTEGPALKLALWDNRRDAGCVRVARASNGAFAQVSEFTVTSAGYAFQDPTCDVGDAYAAARMGFAEFLAVSYLAFCHLPRLRGTEDEVGRTMEDVLAAFLRVPVADAVDALIAEVDAGARTSGFERYAARVLRDADPAALRRVTARHEVALRRLDATGLFWLALPQGELDEGDFDCLIAVEAVLNRLALIAKAAREAGRDALALTSEGFCADEDWRCLRGIVLPAARLLASSTRENPWRTLCGAKGERGGEWDLRTRAAGVLEHLELPCRLVYRFATNAQEGSVTIACMVPPASAMPRWRRGRTGESALVACGAHCFAAASAYAFRLVTVLFAAAFGASAGVVRAHVRLTADRAFKIPVLEAQVARGDFVTTIHERLCDGAYMEPKLTWAATRLAELLAPAKLDFALDDEVCLQPLSHAREGFDPEPVRSCPLHEDTRPVPAALVPLFHADTVRELDVFHLDEDPFAARVQEAANLARRDPAAAAQQLSDLLAVMEVVADVDAGEDVGAEGDGMREAEEPTGGEIASQARSSRSLHPLYCANYLARLAMALVDDDPAHRYRYVPDSAYEARLLLARLCTEHDDATHGVEYARQAIELGPTSSRAYIEAAAAYVELGEPAQAVALMRQALRFDALPASYTYGYYRLAFALWRAGDAQAALACYVRALPNPHMHDAAVEELRALMAEQGLTRPPSADEVEAALARAGVPSAPTDEMVRLCARAVVKACDAGLLNVASLFAQTVGFSVRDDVVSAALMTLVPWSDQQ